MKIRSVAAKDQEEFLAMCSDFYSGDAAIHPIGRGAMLRTFEEALAGNPFLRIVIFQQEKETAGYCQLSFTYSNEAGGLTVLVEEVYVKPEYQGRGLGSAFFAWLFEEYPQAKRFRLEVCEKNPGAERLYKRLGFEPLEYRQMILERP